MGIVNRLFELLAEDGKGHDQASNSHDLFSISVPGGARVSRSTREGEEDTAVCAQRQVVLDLPIHAVQVDEAELPELVVDVVLEGSEDLGDAGAEAGVDLALVEKLPVFRHLRRDGDDDAELFAEALETGSGGSVGSEAWKDGGRPHSALRRHGRAVRPEELADLLHPRFDRIVHRVAGDVPPVRTHRFPDPRVQVPPACQAGQLRQQLLLGRDLLVLGDCRERPLPDLQQIRLVLPRSLGWHRAVCDQFGDGALFGRQPLLEFRLELVDVLADYGRVRPVDEVVIVFRLGAQIVPEPVHPLVAVREERHVCDGVHFIEKGEWRRR